MRARFALVAATLTVCTVFSGNPMAYVANGPTWSQPQTSYYINSANLDLSGFSAETAVRSGADVWQLQSAAFRFAYTDRKSTRLNSSHLVISYAVFCLKKKKLND